MKKIEAIIRKTKFEDVKKSLLAVYKRVEEEGLDIYEHGESCYTN